MSYSFSYMLNENDYYEFNIYHVKNNKKSGTMNNIVRFAAIPIIFAAAALLLGAILRGHYGLSFSVYGIAAAFMIIFYPRLVKRKIARKIENLERKGKLDFTKKTEITFEDDHFTEITKDAELKINYTALKHIAKTENAAYLYIHENIAVIVPRRVFKDEETFGKFVAFMEEKVSRRVA